MASNKAELEEHWFEDGGILPASHVDLAKDGGSFDVFPTSLLYCTEPIGVHSDVAKDGNAFDIYSNRNLGPRYKVETLHISSQSDTYCGKDRKYGGIIIYGLQIRQWRPWYTLNRPSEWRTANGTSCKSGYVVIMQTDTSEFQGLQNKWSSEPGRVHGIIYRKAFGESLNDVKVVGEGFGIIDGEFKITSGALNPSHGDDYHDDSPLMNKDSARFVRALVEIWKDAGPNFPGRQNYTVKELAD